MEKNGMVKRFLAVGFLVIAVIGLTTPGTSAFAETLQPEKEETELPMEQSETTEGESWEQNGTVPEQSVSGNDISEEAAEDSNGTIGALADEDLEADNTDKESKLTDAILEECIVKGTNPLGVTVNLFDYSQGNISDGIREVAHDYIYWSEDKQSYCTLNTYNLGISQGHLLRFGYSDVEDCEYCIDNGYYGEWNEYNKTGPSQGIVKKILGQDGFPVLDLLDNKKYYDFGRYTDVEDTGKYLTDEKKTESLAYLFLPIDDKYKKSYRAVQGLFQPDADGYYYYKSQENFASFNKYTNSFTLYNSPGVANMVDSTVYSGQFFPFNEVTDVFDDYYEVDNGYRLTYSNIADKIAGNDKKDYEPIRDEDGNSYIKCYAPEINHYLGLTLEMRFVQPEGGLVTSSTNESGDAMIFKFSGDDDVWIFIDGVLVADLGGLHDALGLSINFATGVVEVAGETHTLYESFEKAYEGEDSIPSSIKFSENKDTFADNTVHTLKMFYLERGHMASNLSLSFNIQPLPSPPSNNEDRVDNSYEIEEYTSDSDAHIYENVNIPVEISVSDNTLYDSPEIPKTGDDSLIGWWAALCILSLVGIGATVCNLIIRKRKRDK